jgi:hypothetical protein
VSINLPGAVSSRGGAFPFDLTTGAGCSWTARTDVTWADVTPGSGQGTHTVTLNVSEHARRDARTLTITINGQAYRITQQEIPCVYTLGVSSLEAADQGGQLSFMMNAPSGCPWTVSSSDGWIGVRTPNGSGGGSIILQIQPNTGDVRQGFVTVAGQRVNITQRRG